MPGERPGIFHQVLVRSRIVMNINMRSLRWMSAFSLTLALTGCGTISDVNQSGHTDAPIFPEIDSSTYDASYVNLENLSKIGPGMSKNQIQDLIGHPHFSEGMFNVREWDYVLKFRKSDGSPDQVCQYKVLFDKGMQAQEFYFKPSTCMAAESKVSKQEVRELSLSADATFEFDSAELKSSGAAELDRFVDELNSVSVRSIDVVGYTDRFGSAEHNYKLSAKRADAVRDFFASAGVDGEIISSKGLGSQYPVVVCPGAATSKVIKCLAPNRRTTITVHLK